MDQCRNQPIQKADVAMNKTFATLWNCIRQSLCGKVALMTSTSLDHFGTYADLGKFFVLFCLFGIEKYSLLYFFLVHNYFYGLEHISGDKRMRKKLYCTISFFFNGPKRDRVTGGWRKLITRSFIICTLRQV
jgi:hypothetical protein